MRHLAVLFLAAGGVFAADDFITGQAARMVIGQPTFTSQSPDSSDSVLGGVSGIAYANGTLVVTDANRLGAAPLNHRVLIYRDIRNIVPDPGAELAQGTRCPACTGTADVILGNADRSVGLSRTAFRLPTSVATDGVRLAVADTDNNRVLIWNSMPVTNGAPADLVLGQPDFQTDCPNSVGPRVNGACTGDVRVPSARSLRGPQGVWIQGNRLFVADDQNHRVLIWNSFPTQNFAPADVVLGAPNFNTTVEPDLTRQDINAQNNTLLNPVGVSSDGQRLYVADLGHNRVLIWNGIPSTNGAPADVVIGQPDFTSAAANNVTKLCASAGKDESGNDLFPPRCAATLEFPRFALSDGQRLFVADGGNDRILIFNQVPTSNGAAADRILGQINDSFAQTSDNEENPDFARRSSADSVRTPTSLAWDGANLYVSDPWNRRVLVFTVAPKVLPLTSIRNAASLEVFATGSVTISGTIKEGDQAGLSVRGKKYMYTIKKDDTFADIVNGIAALVNAGEGDPWVVAAPNVAIDSIVLTSRLGGSVGNETDFTGEVSSNASIVATANGSKLSGGQDAARIAPGSLISIFAENLADLEDGEVVAAPPGADPLPTELAGVQVYIDGRLTPLVSVTRNQVNAQLPFEVLDSSSASAFVRTRNRDGSVSVTTALAIPVIAGNPGIFAQPGADPRPGVVLHGSSRAVGTILIDGSAKAGEQVIVSIGDRNYGYTLAEGDTLETVRDKLIEQINRDDPEVFAIPAGQFSRIRLRARVEGPAGNGIPYNASSNGSNVLMNRTTEALCCANVEGAPVTEDNPAVPGENIIVYATGLGVVEPDDAKFNMATGFRYKGPELNKPSLRVDSLAGGKTANVLFCGLKPGEIGIYEVHLELLSDLPTNPRTQLWIAQDVNISNVVTFPLVNPNPSPE